MRRDQCHPIGGPHSFLVNEINENRSRFILASTVEHESTPTAWFVSSWTDDTSAAKAQLKHVRLRSLLANNS